MFPDSPIEFAKGSFDCSNVPVWAVRQVLGKPVYEQVSRYDPPFVTISTLSQEDLEKMKEPEKKNEPTKIYIDRYDRNDRIIVPLSRLEVRDTFRVVDDEQRNVYIVVDLKDVIDISTTDPTTVYAINMATAEVVPFDENTQVYVYDPSGIRFKVGEFIKEAINE